MIVVCPPMSPRRQLPQIQLPEVNPHMINILRDQLNIMFKYMFIISKCTHKSPSLSPVGV